MNICGKIHCSKIKDIFNLKNIKNFYQMKILNLPLYGIDYFAMLSNSKICINTHADNQKIFWKYEAF